MNHWISNSFFYLLYSCQAQSRVVNSLFHPFKRATVSNSLTSLFAKKQLWAIPSRCSLQKSDVSKWLVSQKEQIAWKTDERLPNPGRKWQLYVIGTLFKKKSEFPHTVRKTEGTAALNAIEYMYEYVPYMVFVISGTKTRHIPCIHSNQYRLGYFAKILVIFGTVFTVELIPVCLLMQLLLFS